MAKKKKNIDKVRLIRYCDGNLIADLLESWAGFYYGLYHRFEDTRKAMASGEKTPYATSDEERARLAQTEYTAPRSGLVFKSMAEVKKVAALFKEQHGRKRYRLIGGVWKKDMVAILAEVRQMNSQSEEEKGGKNNGNY